MPALTLHAHAKLNLALDVLRKRPDGFHQLRTVFERISLADTITLKTRADGKIRVLCQNPQVPKSKRNLVVRIALKLQEDFSITQGVDISIKKNIPVAAGLAGGSSNGATVLMGLNRLWDLNLAQKDLIHYASWLGSDVAFFIYNTPLALGEGRGEVITPLKVKQKLWHVLVTPKVKMLTKDVFGHFKLNLTKKEGGVNILLPFLRQGDSSALSSRISNDLEPAILSLRPDFIHLKEKLKRAGALGVCFSGSGPSVYALAKDRRHALLIRARIDKRYAQVFVVSTY